MSDTPRDPSLHRMTFAASRAADPARFAASCARGTAEMLRYYATPRPPDWLDMDAEQFIRWLEANGL